MMQRIAKLLSRAGIASRRQAEQLVKNGAISINGITVTDPGIKVNINEKIRFNGKLIQSPENSRLWRFHKPRGLITTNSDERGRPTIYDRLPRDLPRVMSVGRLDINSEGLLLLTNDGALKRYLELPSTGLIRKYRVRANGVHSDSSIEKLRSGIYIELEQFRPIGIRLDRIKGSNVWYTVALKEGRNREIRRAFKYINMSVNRLIRISFGEFKLGPLPRGKLDEIPSECFMDEYEI